MTTSKKNLLSPAIFAKLLIIAGIILLQVLTLCGAATKDIKLDPTNIYENQPSGTRVGDLSATTSGTSISFALVNGAGSNQNNLFVIDGSTLKTSSAAFDYETATSCSIRIRATADDNTTTEGIFIIDIHDVNEEPLAQNTNAIARQGVVTTGNAVAVDPEKQALTYSLLNVPTKGNVTLSTTGAFSYTPNSNGFGADSFSFYAYDGVLTSNIATVTIDISNNLYLLEGSTINMSLEEDSTGAALLLNATNGGITTWIVSTQPAKGSTTISGIGENRLVTYTPNANAYGSDSFLVQVTDDQGGSDSITVHVTITAINDAPTITAIENFSMDEDTTTSRALEIGDLDGDTLTLSFSSDNQALLTSSSIKLLRNGNQVTIEISPVANQFGTGSVTITVADGTTTSSMSFTVAVNAVNDAPTISAISAKTMLEDSSTGAIGFSISDLETSVGGLSLTVSSSNSDLIDTSGIELGETNAEGVTWIAVTPLKDQSGTSIITITISDGTTSSSLSFSLTVTPVNDAPTITSIADQEIAEDTSTAALEFTIGDIDTSTSGLSVTASSSNESLIDASGIILAGSGTARTITIIPLANQFGTSTINISVSDGGITTTTSFAITVTPVNDAPTITSIADQTIAEDTSTAALEFTIGDIDTSTSG
ncbi:MAG: Ig-like domain-containing protein, partial [Clostridia bacterium]